MLINAATPLSAVASTPVERISTGTALLDWCFGSTATFGGRLTWGLPAGGLTLLSGSGGCGKSRLAIAVAASMSRGYPARRQEEKNRLLKEKVLDAETKAQADDLRRRGQPMLAAGVEGKRAEQKRLAELDREEAAALEGVDPLDTRQRERVREDFNMLREEARRERWAARDKRAEEHSRRRAEEFDRQKGSEDSRIDQSLEEFFRDPFDVGFEGGSASSKRNRLGGGGGGGAQVVVAKFDERSIKLSEETVKLLEKIAEQTAKTVQIATANLAGAYSGSNA